MSSRLLLFICLIIGLTQRSHAEELVIAYNHVPPHSTHINGVAGGPLKIYYTSGYHSLERSISMATHGRVDMVWSNSLDELIYMVEQAGLQHQFYPLRLPVEPIPLGVVFSDQGSRKFKIRYDRANNKLLASGVYKKLYQQQVIN